MRLQMWPLWIVLGSSLTGCTPDGSSDDDGSAAATVSPGQSPTPDAGHSPTPAPSATPIGPQPTPTQMPEPSPTPSATPGPGTPSPSPTPAVTPTPVPTPVPTATPPPVPFQLEVAPVDSYILGEKRLSSSSRLLLTWSALPGVDHFEIVASESVGGTTDRIRLEGDALSYQLHDLKSATPYSVEITACLNASCSSARHAGPGSGTPSTEWWQVMGTGNSYETATALLFNANSKPYAFPYGDWAGDPGLIRLYFSAAPPSTGALPAISASTAQASDLDSVMNFQSASGYGLLGSTDVGIATFQAIPMNGFIRLYFEAKDEQQKSRIHYIDSRDGLVGDDFNSTSETSCSGDQYASGDCAYTTILWLDGEPDGNEGILGLRQFKIGYPVRDSYQWDQAPGTFMLATSDMESNKCTSYGFNASYVVWDGSKWHIQYDGDCPRLFTGIQSPMPVHMLEARYKLYYSRNQSPYGGPYNNNHKPVQILYADGAMTGDPVNVDFEDWEPQSQARSPVFVWPDGSALTEGQISYLDDYEVFYPTGDPDFVFMYSNMSVAPRGAFVGGLNLLNP